MSIPPVPPSGPSSPPLIPTSPGTQPGQSNYYSSSISSGDFINIVNFSHEILSTKNLSSEVTWIAQQSSATSRNPFYDACTGSTLEVYRVYRIMEAALEVYKESYFDNLERVTNFNPLLDDYNNQISNDQAAVAALNAAIYTYNIGVYTTPQQRAAALQILTNATNAYNAYANSRNSNISELNTQIANFNTAATATNSAVAGVNASLAQVNFGPLAGQTLYGANQTRFMPVFSTVPTSVFSNPTFTIPNIGNTMTQSAALDGYLQLSTAFQPLFNMVANIFGLTSEILDRQSAFQGYVQYFLQNAVPYLPPAFITPLPKPLLGSGSEGMGGGTGVSLGALIVSLSNPSFEGILAKGIFASKMSSIQMASTLLSTLSVQLLSQIGLLAGPAALEILGKKLPSLDLKSQAATFAVSLAVAQEIQHAVADGVFQNAIQKFLAESFPKLTEAELKSLTVTLSAPLELFALNLGVFQIAQALHSPLLFGQIFSNLSTAVQLGIVSPQPTLVDILNNSETIKGLRGTAALQLTNTERSEQESSNIVKQALAEATQGEDFNKQIYAASLQNQGVSSEEALANADTVAEYIQSEQLSHEILNQRVKADVILQNSISQSILANELVKQIVTNSPNLTNRQLRDELANEFVKNGATQQEAIEAATVAVVGFVPSPITPQNLAAGLYQKSHDLLVQSGYSASEAETLSNQLVSVVLGPPVPGSQTSIHALMEEKLSQVEKLQNEKLSSAVKNSVLAFLAPTMELSVFAERLRDPANAILLSALTGIIYGGKQPSNYLRSVDINV